MKLKSIVFLGLLAIVFSCDSTSNQEETETANVAEPYFFNFDELAHYRIDIDGEALLEKEGDTDINAEEQLQIDLVLMDAPHSINDTLFVAELENIGFAKNQVDRKKFKRINELFKEKEVEESIANDCVAVYRDILIFRKNHKIIGMAKICFRCNQHKIYGTSLNTWNFGQDGDYNRFRKILNQ